MRRAAVLLVLVGLAGCGTSGLAVDPTAPPPRLPSRDAENLSGWHLTGRIRGPLRALGPVVRLDAWLRADGWARVDLQIQEGEGVRRDVLIWSPAVALLVDGRSGTVKTLGDGPGELALEGGVFRVEHAVWLLLGRLPRAPSDLAWLAVEGDWRGRSTQVGLRGRRNRRGEVERTEVVWRTPSGEIRHLRARVMGRDEDSGLPSRLSLSGSPLEARAILEWTPEPVAMMADTTFDPLAR